MRQAIGTPNNIKKPILAKVTKKDRNIFSRKGYVMVGNQPPRIGYSAYLTTTLSLARIPCIVDLPSDFIVDELKESDIVLITADGQVSVVWEDGSDQNSLLITEACDCYCLMCPQPPKKYDANQPILARQILDLLDVKRVNNICLTGGEPTLLKDQFEELLFEMSKKFSDATLSVLTNGKSFSDFEFAKRCALATAGRILFCISLHSDNNHDHDRIVGIAGSFKKTIQGITNLAKLGVPIEIRFVINQINVDRMSEFSDYVYRNFPFAIHVAFMAMEIRGLADQNMAEIWIDPVEYGERVRFAATRLAMRGMVTSIYNMPLCLLPQEGWALARQSISGWKNDYLPQCQQCLEKDNCCGVFTSSSRQSDHIHPILAEPL